jgi:hypothetical protein
MKCLSLKTFLLATAAVALRDLIGVLSLRGIESTEAMSASIVEVTGTLQFYPISNNSRSDFIG